MSTSMDQNVRDIVAHAYTNAPAFRQRMDDAGLTPNDVQSVADLTKVPILPKDDVIALQQSNPPFGGMLAVPMTEIRHIFMSPGPIYEPDGSSDSDMASTMQHALGMIGFTNEDVVINALSYHLVPAGLGVDNALTAVGCTVIPTGFGNSELQVKLMLDLGATGYVGTPSFLMGLLKKAEEMGIDPKSQLKINKALVSAEPLPASLRATLVDEYGITVGNAYATAELGALALNMDGTMAMQLMPEPVIQVVDPETGELVGAGETGEVVVTNTNHAYPLIRFGTGDMAVNVDPNPGNSKQEERAIMLVGRSGEAKKVRGMFVHPNQLRFSIGQVTAGIGGMAKVQGIVSRPADRDVFTVRIALNDASADPASLEEAIHAAIRQACRVRANELVFVSADEIADDAPGMVDERGWN
ncbi:MAG: AMP-binding protein [Chloroflexota bacterium]